MRLAKAERNEIASLIPSVWALGRHPVKTTRLAVIRPFATLRVTTRRTRDAGWSEAKSEIAALTPSERFRAGDNHRMSRNDKGEASWSKFRDYLPQALKKDELIFYFGCYKAKRHSGSVEKSGLYMKRSDK